MRHQKRSSRRSSIFAGQVYALLALLGLVVLFLWPSFVAQFPHSPCPMLLFTRSIGFILENAEGTFPFC